MAYVYRGTNREVEDVAYEYTNDPLRCGKYEGYRKHKRNHETICPPCREAKRIHSAEERAKAKALKAANPPKFDESACGTPKGYQRHVRHNIPKCRPCKKARAEYMAEYREKLKAEKIPGHMRVTRG